MSDAPAPRTPALIVAGRVRIDPTRRDDAMSAAREMMYETRAEPGCIAYTFSGDLDDPGTIWIFEEWESQEALDAHFASPHMRAFQGRLGDLGVREMSVRKYAIASVGSL